MCLFDFGWNADSGDFFFINQSPVILRDGDAFYVSLDPYLERADQPDERAAACFRARGLIVSDE